MNVDLSPSRDPSEIFTAVSYEGEVRELLTRWKFHRESGLTRHFGELVVRALDEASRIGRIRFERIDVVTWAPTSAARRRHRGYDQAELLARFVARELKRPCRRLLVRRSRGSQTGRSRYERVSDGPRFEAKPSRRGLGVLVVDDVVTTGSTLRAAETALSKAGHREVVLVAVCATPSSYRCSAD